MAKKKFSFADAKIRIKELEEQVEALALNTDDNIYTSSENNVIKFYKYGFYVLAIVHILRFL